MSMSEVAHSIDPSQNAAAQPRVARARLLAGLLLALLIGAGGA